MTGGGTAGHVNPNLALVPGLTAIKYEIKYIGSKKGIEKEIIERNKIPYFAISSGKLRRYFDIKNFTDPFRVLGGFFEAVNILRKEKPNLVFSKGGFVSVPVVMAASMLKIPVLSHESDITPGLANKIGAKFVDKLLVTFPETLEDVGEKGILVGSPIRNELFEGDKNKGQEVLKFEENRTTILVMGGSIGSVKINNALRAALPELLETFNVIHLCGKGNLSEELKDLAGYRQYEYVSKEMKDFLQVADLVVSRAGANSIFEFLALKKPNLLIPLSRASSRGDQILNANSFEEKGYSKVLEEEELTETTLKISIQDLYRDREEYIETMRKSDLLDGTPKIIQLIEKYAKA